MERGGFWQCISNYFGIRRGFQNDSLLFSISSTLGALWIAGVHVSGGAHSSVELPNGGERSQAFKSFAEVLYNFSLCFSLGFHKLILF